MDWILAIPALPAAAFAVLVVLSRRARNAALVLAVLAMAIALALSIAAFWQVWQQAPEVGHATVAEAGHAEEGSEAAVGDAHADEAEGDHATREVAPLPEPLYHTFVPIATIGEASVGLGFSLDATAAIMLLVVTIVALCVLVYSLEYMRTDERRGWYFAVVSLFTAAMLGLVLADNYLMLYAMWEIMGLCSYLLIGFWHEQEAPRKAAVKAFLTTRVGDVGFALGLFVIWVNAGTFDLAEVFASVPFWTTGAVTAAALLLLAGAMGKSAQVPLHVWLPDAMAGPTPASALIHAATMVAAGVYLVARSLPLFAASPMALDVVLIVGALTALVGGLLGCVQHDIKKVLAYSTISQLGYMFLALGAAGYVAGMFHLVTHAFFKSLLFLGAGVIIHATHTQDMREMGGLRKLMPWTTAVFTIGSLALAGIFPMSGFFSKDEILASLWHAGTTLGYVAYAVALFTAFVTAFYVARLWFRVFTGYVRTPKAHEGTWHMLVPMTLLATLTLAVGWASVSFAGLLGHEGEWPQPQFWVPSTIAAVGGIAVGWWVYGRSTRVLNTTNLKQRAGYAYHMLAQKLYFDITYEYLFIRPFMRLADKMASFDLRAVDGVVNGAAAAWTRASDSSGRFDTRVIDGAVNGIGDLVRRSGASLRRLQTGRLQSYQRYAIAALVVLVLFVVWRGA